MKQRYIVLACDAAPTYAIYLPLVVRLWRRLGYKALVYLHAEGWDTPFGDLVRAELALAGSTTSIIDAVAPLGIANTMRCARLVAACEPFLDPEDFLLTSDVDMIPLSRTFFDRREDFIVYRGLGDIWMQPAAPVPPRPPAVMRPGEVRFPMCYSGATAEIWRYMLPLNYGIPHDALVDTIAPYLPSRTNYTDLDETIGSYAFLAHPRAQGVVEEVSTGVWRQGDLYLVDPIDAPQLTPHEHMHRGLLLLVDGWIPGRGDPPSAPIDFIPCRFYPGERPWWCFDVPAIYFPEEAAWITSYVERAKVAIGSW